MIRNNKRGVVKSGDRGMRIVGLMESKLRDVTDLYMSLSQGLHEHLDRYVITLWLAMTMPQFQL